MSNFELHLDRHVDIDDAGNGISSKLYLPVPICQYSVRVFVYKQNFKRRLKIHLCSSVCKCFVCACVGVSVSLAKSAMCLFLLNVNELLLLE